MTKKIKGQEVETEEVEYGVLLDNGWVCPCASENEAHMTAAMLGTKVVIRDWYGTAWAELGDGDE